jgi:hypothetical protein
VNNTLDYLQTACLAHTVKIYCICGAVGEHKMDGMNQWWTEYITCGVNEVYDTVTGLWSTKNSLPINGMNLKAHTINGQNFVIADSNLFMYDPVTDVWTQKVSIPLPPRDVRCVASIVVKGKLIVAGEFKYEPAHIVHKFYIYDQKTDTWNENRQEKPIAMLGNVATGATIGRYATEKIYVIGLTCGSYITMESNQVYDPAENTWSVSKAMPIEQYGSGIAVVDDILYVIGGTLTEQYILAGYNSTHVTLEHTHQPSEINPPSKPSKPFSTYIIIISITAVTLVGIITIVSCLHTKNTNTKQKKPSINKTP